MLPRKNRLKLPTIWGKTNPDFQIKAEFFKVVVKTFPEEKPVKVGFVISGKVGKANVRNRLRRQLSQLMQTKLKSIKVSAEIIIIVFPTMAKASNEEIDSSLTKALQKIHI